MEYAVAFLSVIVGAILCTLEIALTPKPVTNESVMLMHGMAAFYGGVFLTGRLIYTTLGMRLRNDRLKGGVGKYVLFIHCFLALSMILLSPLPAWLPRFSQPSFLVLAIAVLWSCAEYVFRTSRRRSDSCETYNDDSR